VREYLCGDFMAEPFYWGSLLRFFSIPLSTRMDGFGLVGPFFIQILYLQEGFFLSMALMGERAEAGEEGFFARGWVGTRGQ